MDDDDPVMAMYRAQAETIEVQAALDETREQLETVKKAHWELIKQKGQLQKQLNEAQLAARPSSSTGSNDRIHLLEGKLEELSIESREIKEMLRKLSEMPKQIEVMKRKMDLMFSRQGNAKQLAVKAVPVNSKPENQTKPPPLLQPNQHNLGKPPPFLVNNPENPPPLLQPTQHDTILVFGGEAGHSGDANVLDFKGNKWVTFSLCLPPFSHCHAAVYLNGSLFVLGGDSNSVTDEAPPDVVSAFGRMPTLRLPSTKAFKFYKVSGDSTKWTAVPIVIVERIDISNSCVAYNKCIWIIGGKIGGGTATTMVQKYDPVLNRLIDMPALNFARAKATATVFKNRLYVCGGIGTPGGYCVTDTVEYYDEALGKWTTITRMPCLLFGFAVVVLNNGLIILGGETHPGSHLFNRKGYQLTYDGVAHKWVEILSWKRGRVGLGAIVIGQEIVTIGGILEAKQPGAPGAAGLPAPTRGLGIYNGKRWREGPVLPNAKAYFHSVIIPVEFANKMIQNFNNK